MGWRNAGAATLYASSDACIAVRSRDHRTGNSAQGTAVTPGGKSAEGGERSSGTCEGSSGQ